MSLRLRFEILKRDGFTCQYCGGRAPDVALQVDHVRPVVLGGTSDPVNLVAACIDCNAGKSDVPLNFSGLYQSADPEPITHATRPGGRTGALTYVRAGRRRRPRHFANLGPLGGETSVPLCAQGQPYATRCRDEAQVALRRELDTLARSARANSARDKSLFAVFDPAMSQVRLGMACSVAGSMRNYRKTRPQAALLFALRPHQVAVAFGAPALPVLRWVRRALGPYHVEGAWFTVTRPVVKVVDWLGEVEGVEDVGRGHPPILPIVSLWTQHLTAWSA